MCMGVHLIIQCYYVNFFRDCVCSFFFFCYAPYVVRWTRQVIRKKNLNFQSSITIVISIIATQQVSSRTIAKFVFSYKILKSIRTRIPAFFFYFYLTR